MEDPMGEEATMLNLEYLYSLDVWNFNWYRDQCPYWLKAVGSASVTYAKFMRFTWMGVICWRGPVFVIATQIASDRINMRCILGTPSLWKQWDMSHDRISQPNHSLTSYSTIDRDILHVNTFLSRFYLLFSGFISFFVDFSVILP